MGNLISSTSIRIDGKLEGNINVQVLEIEMGGKYNGEFSMS